MISKFTTFILLSFICFQTSFILANTPFVLSHQDTLKKKQFSTDTVQKFIKNFGKDSLIHLLDNKIESAKKYISNNTTSLYYSSDINKVLSISKNFKLGLDTLKYEKYNVYEDIFQLYDFKVGNVSFIANALDSLIKEKVDFNKLMFENISNEMSRNSLVVLGGAVLEINPKYFDSIYKKYAIIDSKEIFNQYWWFTQFAKNYPSQDKIPLIYKNKIFSSLYLNYNLPVLATNFRLNPIEINNLKKLGSAIEVLALGLYGDNISISKNSADLMYLLTLQNNDGGWQSSLGSANDSYMSTTYHGLWALCEFRELVQKEKLITLPAKPIVPIKNTKAK